MNSIDNIEANKKYWNDFGSDYSSVWESPSRAEMSKKELLYITNIIKNHDPYLILDVGIGNGRIMEVLVNETSDNSKVFGMDISKSMIDYCSSKFIRESKVVDLQVCNLSKDNNIFSNKFNLVTMIRVLKYNQDWKYILSKIYDSLAINGVYVFTMPNINSISRFSGDRFSENNIRIIHSSIKELSITLSEQGFDVLDIRSFSKLPNFLYHICQYKLYVKGLLLTEKILELVLGKSMLGRELFVTCIKK